MSADLDALRARAGRELVARRARRAKLAATYDLSPAVATLLEEAIRGCAEPSPTAVRTLAAEIADRLGESAADS
jgi:hypothetical protein